MAVLNIYTLFNGLIAYNTRRYFASCIVLVLNTSNEQNVCSYVKPSNKGFIIPLKIKVQFGHFVAPLSVRIFALFYSVITWHILCVFWPNMVKWRNSGIIMNIKTCMLFKCTVTRHTGLSI